ncbi:MAG: laccase domain-containing protein, partial [Symploca sp. SIO1C4]|nr:laccase domain-containing protein [Symploca sp. SIO1C4]
PAITGEVYQVSETVAAQVGTSIVPPETPQTTQSILNILEKFPKSPILEDSQLGRVRLDVRRINELQLEQLGVNPEQVTIAPYCTYQTPEYFFSYRRDKLKKVQWSGIVSK